MPPFRPFEDHASMNYSQLPEEILEDREMLQRWTQRSLDVARAAKRTRARGQGASKSAKKTAKKTAKKPTTTTTTTARKTAKKTATRSRRSS
jgi:TfoX/Sxy family transcriptional regulator of competence genes